MDSRLIAIAGVSVALLLVVAFFMGMFNPLIEFVFLFGFVNFILLLLIIAILAGVAINFEGMPRLLGVLGLMVIAFIFLFIPNFVITYGFPSLFSLGFVGFFVAVVIIDVLSYPYPTLELILMIPLKKYFGIPSWLGMVFAWILAIIGFFILAAFYPFIWQILLQSFDMNLIKIVLAIIYFIVVIIVFDKLTDSMMGD